MLRKKKTLIMDIYYFFNIEVIYLRNDIKAKNVSFSVDKFLKFQVIFCGQLSKYNYISDDIRELLLIFLDAIFFRTAVLKHHDCLQGTFK